ncbi:hydrogenase maturation protein [Hydrogenophilus islandicus]
MRILMLVHAFNSLSQRIFAELRRDGHEVSIEFDISDAVTEEAVALWQPEVIVAPFLKHKVPESVWRAVPTLILHPGPPGDRGPNALDHAILRNEAQWGVTVLQAVAEYDAGPIWAALSFPMRQARKADLYRREVTEAAVTAFREALARLARGDHPEPSPPGIFRPALSAAQRTIDWAAMTTDEILRIACASDNAPGAITSLFGEQCRIFDLHPEEGGGGKGKPGEVVARRDEALLVATRDGAVWVGQVRRTGGLKLPALVAFPEAAELPQWSLNGYWEATVPTWQEIAYRETGAVGFLRFSFANGAMSTAQCRRLLAALEWAFSRPTRVLVLEGGEGFWSNGIHLHVIEAAERPADASMANIEAIDDLAEALIRHTGQITIAALAGNAAAGGCFLARACDIVWVRRGVVLNPHYKNMGNLYGSEFWTYLLPSRLGNDGAKRLMAHRLPILGEEAVELGFYDAVLPSEGFSEGVAARAAALAADETAVTTFLARKVAQRAADEAARPLADYRREELEAMARNFYGFDPAYHVARYHFVHRTPHSWTPLHLARHRQGNRIAVRQLNAHLA